MGARHPDERYGHASSGGEHHIGPLPRQHPACEHGVARKRHERPVRGVVSRDPALVGKDLPRVRNVERDPAALVCFPEVTGPPELGEVTSTRRHEEELHRSSIEA